VRSVPCYDVSARGQVALTSGGGANRFFVEEAFGSTNLLTDLGRGRQQRGELVERAASVMLWRLRAATWRSRAAGFHRLFAEEASGLTNLLDGFGT
jgi:hypothetical protein